MTEKNKKIILLLTRFFDIFVGLISIFIVVINTPPEIYALTGIAAIYTNILMMLPNLGFETIFIRNHLYWKDSSDKGKSNFYYSIALKSKLYIGGLIAIILLFVSLYYSKVKFSQVNNSYIILCIFIITAFINSINDSQQLFLIGNGDFLIVNINRFIFITCYKLILLLNLEKLGFINYIVLLQLNTIVLYISNHIYIRINTGLYYVKTISFKNIFYEIKKSKNFIIENYMRFLGNTLDQIVFSMILPTSLFSSFNLAKTIETTFRQVIDIYFDPLTQNLVKFKKDIKILNTRFININKNRIVLSILFIIGFGLYLLIGEFLINLLNLNKYIYLNLFICFSIINILIYLIYKPELNVISLLFDSKYKILISSVTVINLFFYLTIFIDIKFAATIRMSYHIMTLFFVFVIYYIKGGLKNEKNIHCDV